MGHLSLAYYIGRKQALRSPPTLINSGGFHGALQGVIALLGKVHHLNNFGLGHFKCIDPAHANTLLVDMQHDCIGVFAGLVEDALQHMDDEFHWGVIVIEQQHFVKRWFLGAGFWPGDDLGVRIIAAFCRELCHRSYIVAPGLRFNCLIECDMWAFDTLDVQACLAHKSGAGGDEVEAFLGLVTHQLFDHAGG